MTNEIAAIDAAVLYELEDGETHNGWTRVAVQHRRTSRWHQLCWLVITRGDGCFGIPFSVGLTENQDPEFPWADSFGQPIPLTPLAGVQITSIKYMTPAEYAKHLAP